MTWVIIVDLVMIKTMRRYLESHGTIEDHYQLAGKYGSEFAGKYAFQFSERKDIKLNKDNFTCRGALSVELLQPEYY